jgi:hypothetical protein
MHRREFTQAFSGVAVAGLWLPAKLLKMTGQGRRVDERVTAFPA